MACHKSRFLRALPCLIILAAACSSARVSQFDTFAAAGAKFADAVPPVLDHSFQTAVETDSLLLVQSRETLDQDARLEAIETSNENLGERLSLLRDLKAHAKLLRSYFLALGALAQSDEGSGVGEAAKQLVEAMGRLEPRIVNARVGGISVSEFVQEASGIAVAAFQASALERELKANAGTIERELNIQEAAISLLADAVRAEKETQWAALQRDRIILPYVTSGSLPPDWNERRLAAFERVVQLGAVDAAAQAAQGLRLSFLALVENRLNETAIALLRQDVNRLLSLVERIKGVKPPGR